MCRAVARCASMAGFNAFENLAITIAGNEFAHRMRKGQFSFGRDHRRAYCIGESGRTGSLSPYAERCAAMIIGSV